MKIKKASQNCEAFQFLEVVPPEPKTFYWTLFYFIVISFITSLIEGLIISYNKVKAKILKLLSPRFVPLKDEGYISQYI